MKGIVAKLVAIQGELKSPKDQNAGRYRYRNIEDINEAVKPIAAAQGCAVRYSDTMDVEGGIAVCRSICELNDGEGFITASAFAVVNTEPKGMSVEQACGAASSYARKYAACGLFAIDSSENDPDRTQPKAEKAEPKAREGSRDAAARRLWEACVRYAERHGRDPNEVAEGVKARGDYRDTAAFLNLAADEMDSEVG